MKLYIFGFGLIIFIFWLSKYTYTYIYITERQNIDFNRFTEQHINVINIEDGRQKRCTGNGRSPKNILSHGESIAIES